MAQMIATPQNMNVVWCSVPLKQANNWNFPPQILPNTWVRLLEFLNPFCYEEALILCQHSDSEWVVWIPDHGEAILHSDQFCLF